MAVHPIFQLIVLPADFSSYIFRCNDPSCTEEYLAQMELNERQVKAVMYVKKHGRITNKEFIALTPQKVTAKTASRDLKRLCDIGILTQIGTTGKGTYYILSSPRPPKEDINGT